MTKTSMKSVTFRAQWLDIYNAVSYGEIQFPIELYTKHCRFTEKENEENTKGVFAVSSPQFLAK